LDRIFPVKIASTESVGGLKKAIKAEKSPEFDAFAADTLDLYRVSIPIKDFDAKLTSARSPEEVEGSAKLHPWDGLEECLSSPLKKHIHVIPRVSASCSSTLIAVSPSPLSLSRLVISSISCYASCSVISTPSHRAILACVSFPVRFSLARCRLCASCAILPGVSFVISVRSPPHLIFSVVFAAHVLPRPALSLLTPLSLWPRLSFRLLSWSRAVILSATIISSGSHESKLIDTAAYGKLTHRVCLDRADEVVSSSL
jgi:hypothetical protein